MHEQSETVQNNRGKWINVYGRNLPQAGQQLPGTPEYETVDQAVEAAQKRSQGYHEPERQGQTGRVTPMADQYDPNQPNPLPVSGGDWSSMASAIIPGIIGLVAGRGNPIAGVAGLAGGAEAIQSDRDRAIQYNNQLQFRKQVQANEQERLGLEKQHYETLNATATEAMKLHQAQAAKIYRDTQEATQDLESFKKWAGDLPDGAIKTAAMADLTKTGRDNFMKWYRENELTETATLPAARAALQAAGMSPAEVDAYSNAMPPKKLIALSAEVTKAKLAHAPIRLPNPAGNYDTVLYPDGSTRSFPHTPDPRSGAAGPDKPLTVPQATKLDADMRKYWEASLPVEKRVELFNMPQEEKENLYQQWAQGPGGQSFISGKLGNVGKKASDIVGGGGGAPSAPKAALDLPPPPAQNKGRIIRDTQTGKRLKSDGTMWVPLKD